MLRAIVCYTSWTTDPSEQNLKEVVLKPHRMNKPGERDVE